MRNVKTMEPVVIRTSRSKTLLLLVASLVFVFSSFSLAPGAISDGLRWGGIVFFGLCALVFAWTLARPQTLMLDGNGFAVGGGFIRSPHLILWKDVQGFYVYNLPRSKTIGYKFEPGVREGSTLRGVARSLGLEGVLPNGWPMPVEKTVEFLNDYRRQALAG